MDEESAKCAMRNLHNTEFGGRHLRVDYQGDERKEGHAGTCRGHGRHQIWAKPPGAGQAGMCALWAVLAIRCPIFAAHQAAQYSAITKNDWLPFETQARDQEAGALGQGRCVSLASGLPAARIMRAPSADHAPFVFPLTLSDRTFTLEILRH
jgi:hypothetical protein